MKLSVSKEDIGYWLEHGTPIDETCSWCLGAGTVQGMAGRGPDTWDCDVECSRCGGTGALPVPDSADRKPPLATGSANNSFGPSPMTPTPASNLSDEQIIDEARKHATAYVRDSVLTAFARAVIAADRALRPSGGRDLATCGHPVESGGERPAELSTDECICRGNWRAIVQKDRHLLDRKFRDNDGNVWSFFGFVLAEDDYYYGMWRKGYLMLRSCVGRLIEPGWELVVPPASDSQESGSTECKESSPLSPASKGIDHE